VLRRWVSVLRGLSYAVRSGLGRWSLFRHLRYLYRYPGLSVDPTTNMVIGGKLSFGKEAAIGERCHILVPYRASLAIGKNCYLGRNVEVSAGGDIVIGDYSSIQDRSILVGDVNLGRYCVLSLNVLMTSGRHYFNKWPPLLIRDQDARVAADLELSTAHSRPITIEEDCWLGMNSVVMPGVTIGRGSVVGSNTVVTHDVPPYSVVVGAPARVVQKRFEFSPPIAIDHEKPDDIPYFYRGFELSEEERNKNLQLGGHLARGSFAVWLSGGRTIVLVARCLSGEQTCISRDKQTNRLTESWTEVKFDRDDGEGAATFAAQDGAVVVSRAWTE
jgi:acetyltransferase-like isoleucine patch superfamily enzyme